MPYITLTPDTIQSEHICCAFSDKKCAESYALKKAWLAREFDQGYVFRRLGMVPAHALRLGVFVQLLVFACLVIGLGDRPPD